jgi:hypothetical protein
MTVVGVALLNTNNGKTGAFPKSSARRIYKTLRKRGMFKNETPA